MKYILKYVQMCSHAQNPCKAEQGDGRFGEENSQKQQGQLGSAASNQVLSQRKWRVRANNPGCPLTSIHTVACTHPHILITYIHTYLTS